eukprot:jgi/Mesvir1/17335/Mv07730-RA.1
MVADRVVAWARRSLATYNLHLPSEIVKRMAAVKGLRPQFIDHNDLRRPAFSGWKRLLDKYIKDLPAGFTSNYVFEFYDGKVRMQHLVSTQDEEARRKSCCVATRRRRSRMHAGSSLGWSTSQPGWTRVIDIQLPRAPVVTLEPSKVKSIQKKYDTIPDECLYYYVPQPVEVGPGEEEEAPAGTIMDELSQRGSASRPPTRLGRRGSRRRKQHLWPPGHVCRCWQPL